MGRGDLGDAQGMGWKSKYLGARRWCLIGVRSVMDLTRFSAASSAIDSPTS